MKLSFISLMIQVTIWVYLGQTRDICMSVWMSVENVSGVGKHTPGAGEPADFICTFFFSHSRISFTKYTNFRGPRIEKLF